MKLRYLLSKAKQDGETLMVRDVVTGRNFEVISKGYEFTVLNEMLEELVNLANQSSQNCDQSKKDTPMP